LEAPRCVGIGAHYGRCLTSRRRGLLRAPRTDASLLRMPQLEGAQVGAADARLARAFATGWNDVPAGSVYTRAQFEDWLEPITAGDVEGRDVLELGCGNGSLLLHMSAWRPRHLVGVALSDSVVSARDNLKRTRHPNGEVVQHDLVSYRSKRFDLVYCI